MQVLGKEQGWKDTGIRVVKGDTLKITASGQIRFATSVPFSNGYPRDPDGKDEHGNIQYPENEKWPAPHKIRNSLVFRVGSWIGQGGTNATLIAGETGWLGVSNNDDDSRDNDGFWLYDVKIIEPIGGQLNQKSLFVFHGSNTISIQNHIKSKISSFIAYLNKFTNGKISINPEFCTLPSSFTISPDFDKIHDMPDFNKDCLYLEFNRELTSQGINLNKYQSFFLFYDEYTESHNPKSAGLSWAWVKASVIPIKNGNILAGLDELILHEYIHHLDYYFDQIREADFINPDCFTGKSGYTFCRRAYNIPINTFYTTKTPQLIDFYESILKWFDRIPEYGGNNFVPINYRKLDQVFGEWK